MATYESDIVLGSRYRDSQTRLEGVAVVISFHQFACERVVLENATVDGDDLKMWEFDAARLEPVGEVKAQPAAIPTGASVGRVRRSGRRPA